MCLKIFAATTTFSFPRCKMLPQSLIWPQFLGTQIGQPYQKGVRLQLDLLCDTVHTIVPL